MFKGTSVFKRTQDNWYPSYQLYNNFSVPDDYEQLVEVSFMELLNGKWRVCVWGNDDMGMEKDYPYRSWTEFINIISMEFVNQDRLREMGFHPA